MLNDGYANILTLNQYCITLNAATFCTRTSRTRSSKAVFFLSC